MKRILIITSLLLIALFASARQPQRGYRGFFDWSNSVRSDKFWYSEDDRVSTTSHYWGFSTSHGYQINPIFFVGAGLAMEKCSDLGNWIAPVFVQGRADFKFGNYTPFGDLRLGVNMAEGAGVYFSPTVGYRFNWGRKMGVNLGLGLTLGGYKAEHYDIIIPSPDEYIIEYLGTRRHVRAYFSFRVGIDF